LLCLLLICPPFSFLRCRIAQQKIEEAERIAAEKIQAAERLLQQQQLTFQQQQAQQGAQAQQLAQEEERERNRREREAEAARQEKVQRLAAERKAAEGLLAEQERQLQQQLAQHQAEKEKLERERDRMEKERQEKERQESFNNAFVSPRNSPSQPSKPNANGCAGYVPHSFRPNTCKVCFLSKDQHEDQSSPPSQAQQSPPQQQHQQRVPNSTVQHLQQPNSPQQSQQVVSGRIASPVQVHNNPSAQGPCTAYVPHSFRPNTCKNCNGAKDGHASPSSPSQPNSQQQQGGLARPQFTVQPQQNVITVENCPGYVSHAFKPNTCKFCGAAKERHTGTSMPGTQQPSHPSPQQQPSIIQEYCQCNAQTPTKFCNRCGKMVQNVGGVQSPMRVNPNVGQNTRPVCNQVLLLFRLRL
jgi:hypothetical protein